MNNDDILQLKIDQVGQSAREYAKAIAEMMAFAVSTSTQVERPKEYAYTIDRSQKKQNFIPGQIAFVETIDRRVMDVIIDGTQGDDLVISGRDGRLISTKYPSSKVFHTIAELYACQNKEGG